MTTTEKFRTELRAQEIGAHYSGIVHFLLTNIVAIALTTGCLIGLTAVRPAEWLTLPLTFFFANFVEYFAHRAGMHHVVPGLMMLYRNHAIRHHRFFTHEAMGADSPRDFHQVLFGPLTACIFLGTFLIPIAALLYFTAGANSALLYVATGLIYFLNYEWLHLIYHCPKTSWLKRLPVKTLSRLHTLHHDPRVMSRKYFNITFPVADWIFKTGKA